MLRHLAIRDFVLVDRLELEFLQGFGALTGETGAGKSILLDALSLLLGARADSALVRQGCERAELAGSFACAAEGPLAAWLAAADLPCEDELLVRRVVEAGGRSRGYVNGTPVTAQQMKDLGDLLADIHGQHAHHALLRPEVQRELLDAQAGAQGLVRELGAAWRRYSQAQRALEGARAQGDVLAQEREVLQWQLAEAQALAFEPAAWAALNLEQQRLAHAAGLIEGCGSALAALQEQEPALGSEVERLAARMADLSRIDPALAAVAQMLGDAAISLSEAAAALRRYQEKLEMDPAALAELERRIAAVMQFARKHRCTAEGIPALVAGWQARFDALAEAADIDALAAAEAAALSTWQALAAQLTERRQAAASQLGAAVSEAMQALAMAGGRFAVQLQPVAGVSASGAESVEFCVAANASQALRPLAKVASGGELSRIGLAIQVIASRASSAPTLVFDEVDVGIGGRVAEIVGRHLKALGRERQVLVVTHLPQVAAQADWQWQVLKGGEGGSLRSTVRQLDAAQRIEEIARMLGGVEITETTRAHAAELLGLA